MILSIHSIQKTLVALMSGIFLSITAFASDVEFTEDGCFDSDSAYYSAGLNAGFTVTRRFDDHTYEIRPTSGGPHALLNTKKTIFKNTGRFQLQMRRKGRKSVLLDNGFTGDMNIYEECVPKETPNAAHEEKTSGDYNSCNQSCYERFSGKKAEANNCYAACNEKYGK